MSDNVKVTLAYPWTDADGKNHKADTTVSVPREVGSDLIYSGRARAPETQAKSADSVKEK